MKTAKDSNEKAVRLRLFPFHLKDKAKAWLKFAPIGTY